MIADVSILSRQASAIPAILIYIKLSIKSPLRDAQRYASAGPVSIKGQAFGLPFYADTRAHSVFLRAMALHSTCWAGLAKWGGFGSGRENIWIV
jgi:hypothetical protein